MTNEERQLALIEDWMGRGLTDQEIEFLRPLIASGSKAPYLARHLTMHIEAGDLRAKAEAMQTPLPMSAEDKVLNEKAFGL